MSTIKNFSGAVANKKKQAGLALLEMIIAIGILGVISAAVVMLSTKAFSSMNIKDAVSTITTLDTDLKNAYRSQGNYDGVKEAVTNKVLPKASVKNPFGADIVLAAKPYADAANRGFTMGIPGLNLEQCTKLVNSVGNAFKYVGTVDATDIAKGDVKNAKILVVNGVGELQAAQVNAACTPASNGTVTLYVGNS